MAHLPVIPLTTGQRLMGGTVIFKIHGTNKWLKIGPVGAANYTPTLTEVESRSDETGRSKLIGTWITATDAVLQIADVQMWTPMVYDAMFLAKRTYRTQAAVASATMIVEDVAVGDVVEIPGIKPNIVSVTDGAASDPVEYAEDETGYEGGHYIYQKSRSLLEFTKIPAGADSDAEITYSLPAITEADKVVSLEIMKTNGVRGECRILGAVAEGMPGQAQDYIFPDVEFRPSGDVTLKGVDALNVASLTAKVYDLSGAGYGFVRPVIAA